MFCVCFDRLIEREREIREIREGMEIGEREIMENYGGFGGN